MLKATLAKRLAALLLTVTGALAVPGQASAALFVGDFDPAFGLAFPNLGFRGQGTFFVPDTCLGMNGVVTNSACPGISVTSAFVNYYDTRSTPPPPTLVSQGYVFPPPNVPLIDVRLLGGNLLGVDSGTIGPQFVNVPDTMTVDPTDSLLFGNTWLRFQDLISVGDEGALPGAFLFACSGRECGLNSTTQSNPAFFRNGFTRVPEPDTVGLVLTALVIAGLVRRRRGQGANASLAA